MSEEKKGGGVGVREGVARQLRGERERKSEGGRQKEGGEEEKEAGKRV